MTDDLFGVVPDEENFDELTGDNLRQVLDAVKADEKEVCSIYRKIRK